MKKIIMLSVLLASINTCAMDKQKLENKIIGHVNYQEGERSKTYSATLHNGDVITAYVFIHGPLTGKVYCTRNVKRNNGIFFAVRLEENIFDKLEDLYQTQAK